MIIGRSIKVKGNVQGVFFRATTQEIANQMGVLGTVKNEQDGSVSICAVAEEKVMERFIKWCHTGSGGSRVDEVWVNEISINHYHTFEIIRE